MKHRPATFVLLLCAALLCAAPVLAASAVFDGDPIDPATQLPYEILPGRPLVQPGPDGIPGTADDVVNPAIVGDIDIVVRSGAPAAAAVIPPPAASAGRAALPAGVAGPSSAGGTEIPFTVFLSNGATSAAEPAGRLLAAADMDGLPVIVAAFPDLDGDGVIGPTLRDRAGASDLYLELRELEPVGRAAALFSGGVARGSIAVRSGLPASRGGLTVALVAMALTGPLDPAFFAGVIPSGPGISTDLPFIPIRDLNRLIRDRPAAAGPNTTLQQLVQSAAVPLPDTYAMPLDGSDPSIDTAVVTSQPAIRVSIRASGSVVESEPPLTRVAVGTTVPASSLSLRVIPVDRFENPADPPPNFAVDVRADSSLRVLGQQRRPRPLFMATAAGRRVLARVAPGAVDGTTGAVRFEREGIAVAALSYTVDARANRPIADAVVPSHAWPTVQSAIDGATDRNGDGVITVQVRAGVFREHLVIGRPVELIGAGATRTIVSGDGTSPVITAAAPGAMIRGVSVTGGTSGFALTGNGARVASSAAWRNVGSGVLMSAPNAEVWASRVTANGAEGISIGGAGGRCEATVLDGNTGPGVVVQAAGGVRLRGDQAVENDGDGLLLSGAQGVEVRDTQSALNIGVGIELLESTNATVIDNVCAANDDDGLRMDRADDAVVVGNGIEDNKGNGIFLRRSTGADFATAPGVQDPPGDNTVTGNRKGDVFIRTN